MYTRHMFFSAGLGFPGWLTSWEVDQGNQRQRPKEKPRESQRPAGGRPSRQGLGISSGAEHQLQEEGRVTGEALM